jgi:uncharacterized membrane protein required for colicin V production
MKISGVNPETKEAFQSEASGVTDDFIKSMSEFEISEAGIKKLIDDLNISADQKSVLYKISTVTIRAGEFILKIGRKIIDFVCSMFKEYPTASFGMVFGGILGFLISAIPIIGFVLGPIVTPILIALGLMMGSYEDIKDKNLSRKIAEINAKFSALNT